ncbi:hypothetical protein JHK85_010946 [Glycine max]|nr:hypothetical protein JHK85_010946 [Glycine max]KAG5066910.1 hypothetical protein JHK86_010641 [Glycine max]
MFGKTAEECRQELIAGGDEIKVFPKCVDDLVGKTLALRFKYRVNMRQSFVMDVSQEEHHIHTLTLKIGLQDERTIGKSPASCAETSSGDYHPTVRKFGTPFIK